jgi:D-glycerate 3-kinase
MRIKLDYKAFLLAHRLPKSYIEHAQKWFIPILNRIQTHRDGAKPYIVGINGSQGSGKSTLA